MAWFVSIISFLKVVTFFKLDKEKDAPQTKSSRLQVNYRRKKEEEGMYIYILTAKPIMATRHTKSSFCFVKPMPPEVPKRPSSTFGFGATT